MSPAATQEDAKIGTAELLGHIERARKPPVVISPLRIMARVLSVGNGATPAAILSILLLLVAWQSPACAQMNQPSISGRAFYTSALSSCEVWSDVVDQDGMLESGEPRAATGESGAYLIGLSGYDGVPMEAALVPVVSGTGPEGTCVDSASLEQPAMQLTAPSGCTILSPLGTLTAELVKGDEAAMEAEGGAREGERGHTVSLSLSLSLSLSHTHTHTHTLTHTHITGRVFCLGGGAPELFCLSCCMLLMLLQGRLPL